MKSIKTKSGAKFGLPLHQVIAPELQQRPQRVALELVFNPGKPNSRKGALASDSRRASRDDDRNRRARGGRTS